MPTSHRKRQFHLTCRGCGAHLVTQPNIGGGQVVTCKCGRRQPGLPALWYAWDRVEAMKAMARLRDRRKREKRALEEAGAGEGG